jgi:hypothetical protein
VGRRCGSLLRAQGLLGDDSTLKSMSSDGEPSVIMGVLDEKLRVTVLDLESREDIQREERLECLIGVGAIVVLRYVV